MPSSNYLDEVIWLRREQVRKMEVTNQKLSNILQKASALAGKHTKKITFSHSQQLNHVQFNKKWRSQVKVKCVLDKR